MDTVGGVLDSDTLRARLQNISDGGAARTLLVSDGTDDKVFQFRPGEVRCCTSDGRRVASIEDFLIRQGLVRPQKIRIAIEKSRAGQGELQKVLVGMGLLSREQYQAATVDLVVEELADLVTWEGVHYAFHTGPGPRELFEPRYHPIVAPAEPGVVGARVLEWAARWDELRTELSSERLVPVVAPTQDDVRGNLDVSLHVGHLLPYINGRRSLRELASSAELSMPKVVEAVREGLCAGFLQVSLPPSESPSTKTLVKRLNKLEERLPSSLCPTVVRSCLSKVYADLGDSFRASEQYQAMGNLYLKSGEISLASHSFRRAVEICPANVAAHETLVYLLHRGGADDVAMRELGALRSRLEGFGMSSRAIDLMKKMPSQVGRGSEIKSQLADVLAREGRTREAITEYLAVARAPVKSDEDAAVSERAYSRVLELDPKNPIARADLKALRRRRRSSSAWFARLCAALAVLLIGAWGASEGLARLAWANSREDILEEVEKDVRTGLQRLRAVGKTYPGNLLDEELARLEEKLFRDHFFAFEDLLQETIELNDEGRCVEALKVLEVGAKRSPLESQRRRGEELARRIRSFRDSWLKMRRRAEMLLDASYRQEAFTICREIIENYSEGAQGMKVPLLVQSTTPGARVMVEGALWGYTPVWIHLEYGKNQKVEVLIPGVPAKTLEKLEHSRTANINVVIGK